MEERYKYVKYFPWVGEKYHHEEVRILIVGRNSHSEDPLSVNPYTNKECVESYFEAESGERFYDTFDRVTDIFRHKGEGKVEAWNRVSFYNFVQEVLPDSRSMPTSEQYVESTPAYLEVLRTLRPHKVIFWGQTLYNNVLCGYGREAQRLEGHETWMVDLSEVIEDEKEGHVVHSTYINDPSFVVYDTKGWRKMVREFLSVVAEEYKDPQVKRRVGQILNVMNIGCEGMVTKSGMDLATVLAKAVSRGLLRFEPEVANADVQCFRGENMMATIYFASKLRDSFFVSEDACKAEVEMMRVVKKMLDSDRFSVKMSEEGGIVVTGKRKSETREMYERVIALRHKELNEKKLSWDELERLMGVKYMRQNLKKVRREMDYVGKIDVFFERCCGAL